MTAVVFAVNPKGTQFELCQMHAERAKAKGWKIEERNPADYEECECDACL